MEREAAIGGITTGSTDERTSLRRHPTRRWRGLLPLLGAAALLIGGDARAQAPTGTQLFARLPAEANSPEGIALNPATGDIIIGTFEPGGSNFLLRFDRSGQLLARLSTGRVPMLGLAFNEKDQKIYIASTQPPRVLRVPVGFSANTPIETVATVPALPGATRPVFPDAVAFRPSSGDLFISDAMQGAIFVISDPSVDANICAGRSDCVRVLSSSPMLRPNSNIVPFGANGIEVSRSGDLLFVANTGRSQLLSIRLDGNAEVRVIASIRFADGLTQPTEGTVAIASSTGNNIVVVDANTGAPRAVLGSATGPGALAMPASLVRSGNDLIVTNLGGRTPVVSRIPLPENLR